MALAVGGGLGLSVAGLGAGEGDAGLAAALTAPWLGEDGLGAALAAPWLGGAGLDAEPTWLPLALQTSLSQRLPLASLQLETDAPRLFYGLSPPAGARYRP
jgi:hypothetical protein